MTASAPGPVATMSDTEILNWLEQDAGRQVFAAAGAWHTCDAASPTGAAVRHGSLREAVASATMLQLQPDRSRSGASSEIDGARQVAQLNANGPAASGPAAAQASPPEASSKVEPPARAPGAPARPHQVASPAASGRPRTTSGNFWGDYLGQVGIGSRRR